VRGKHQHYRGMSGKGKKDSTTLNISEVPRMGYNARSGNCLLGGRPHGDWKGNESAKESRRRPTLGGRKNSGKETGSKSSK